MVQPFKLFLFVFAGSYRIEVQAVWGNLVDDAILKSDKNKFGHVQDEITSLTMANLEILRYIFCLMSDVCAFMCMCGG